jgi:hypothetical protein
MLLLLCQTLCQMPCARVLKQRQRQQWQGYRLVLMLLA